MHQRFPTERLRLVPILRDAVLALGVALDVKFFQLDHGFLVRRACVIDRQLFAASHTINGFGHCLKVSIDLVRREFVALLEQG